MANLKRGWFLALLASIPFVRPVKVTALPVSRIKLPWPQPIYDSGFMGPYVPNPSKFVSRPSLAICFGQYDDVPVGRTPEALKKFEPCEHPYIPPSEARRMMVDNYQSVYRSLTS